MIDNNENTSFFTRMTGFEIKKAKKDEPKISQAIVEPVDMDGENYVTTGAGFFSHSIDLDPIAKESFELIRQYRGAAVQAEVSEALDNIVNEAITCNPDEPAVKLSFTKKSKMAESVREKVTTEFENIVDMLKFNEKGHEIFRKWYVDGRLFHILHLDENKKKDGIIDIRPMDALKVRKRKEKVYKKDPKTGFPVIAETKEYFIFENKPLATSSFTIMAEKTIISPDTVSYVTSGERNPANTMTTSHLHVALKCINQLRMMEDSLVIYRLARAPERRIFYVDTGMMQTAQAEKHMSDLIAKYRNKLEYDPATGKVRDNKKHMSLLEDYWLPRREGGRGTEITTLPGGENLGKIEDIEYFEKKMFRTLKVPMSRLDSNSGGAIFNTGGGSEVSRDELKFQKFINNLRIRFAHLFLDILEKQLMLKEILKPHEWDLYRRDLIVDFTKDNYYAEEKESQITRERIDTANGAMNIAGFLVSRDYIWRKVFGMNDAEINEMKQQIQEEIPIMPKPEPETPASK